MVIAVCDDMDIWRDEEIKCVERLKSEINEDFQCIAFSSGKEVLEYSEHIDILLLDVEMPEMNGIETMKLLEDNDNVRAILFVSGYDSYVFDAFSSKTKGFLRKPLDYEMLAREIKIIINQWKRKERKIEIATVNGLMTQLVDDIVYMYAASNYVKLYTKNNEYMLYGNLKYWEEKLEKYNIVRVHKSYLVNLENVWSIKNDVEMSDRKLHIPLGRKYRDSSRRLYKEHILEKFRE